jgi:ribosomal protein S18 acetylase RimI-like enzyme
LLEISYPVLTPEQLEAYLRKSAALTYEVEEVGPFLLFVNPDDALIYFNYAKPTRPFPADEVAAGSEAELALLVAAFEARGRLPRFEFMEEYAPGLPAILRRAGFVEEARQAFMVCEAENFRPVDLPSGLAIRALTPNSPVEELRGFIAVQRQGFDEDDMATADVVEAERMRARLGVGDSLHMVAWRGDEPVGAAGCTAILDGLSELVGVATPPRYRRRGFGTALSATAVAAQFAAGAEAVILTAQDAAAGRIYERIGFRPFGMALAYSLTN